MKVAFLTLGTRGDVQPYVALAKELIKYGHEALVCTGASFKRFILENGVGFHEAAADLMAILESPQGKELYSGGQFNIFKMLKYAREVISPAYRMSMDDFLDASRGADIIVYHPKALGAVDIAEYLNIPCICMSPVPIIYPITEFPNFVVSPNKNFGPFLNRLTYKVTARGESSHMKYINDFREKSIHLPERKARDIGSQANGRDIPILYPISPYLFKEVESWKDRVYLSGFFYMDIGEVKLDEELNNFLETGCKPIVVSFSSMPLKDPKSFKDKLTAALRETGNRAVVLTGTSGMDFENSEDIFAVDKAPHRLIFSKAKGIIHHGGVGTLSEALLSGKPQLIIPFTGDQPFWAHRLHSKGYAVSPLREKDLGVSDLVKALREMENDKYINNAREIKGIIEAEDGLNNAVGFVEKIYKTHRKVSN